MNSGTCFSVHACMIAISRLFLLPKIKLLLDILSLKAQNTQYNLEDNDCIIKVITITNIVRATFYVATYVDLVFRFMDMCNWWISLFCLCISDIRHQTSYY